MAVLGGDNITEASGQVLEIYAVVRNQTLPGETPGLGFDCRGGGCPAPDVTNSLSVSFIALDFCGTFYRIHHHKSTAFILYEVKIIH